VISLIWLKTSSFFADYSKKAPESKIQLYTNNPNKQAFAVMQTKRRMAKKQTLQRIMRGQKILFQKYTNAIICISA